MGLQWTICYFYTEKAISNMPKPSLIFKTAAITLAATLCSFSPATAQEEDISVGSTSLSNEELADIIQSSSQSIFSSGSSLNGLLSSLGVVGSSEIPLPEDFTPGSPDYPKETREDIDDVEIAGEHSTNYEDFERWEIESPAMKRDVSVYVKEADRPGPTLYLLDGIDSPTPPDFLRQGKIDELLNDDDLNIVMPLDARGSMFYDWEQDDEELGHMKWETFLSEELPSALESSELPENGKRAVGGVSMGATGAANLINKNPDVFDGLLAVSGCYSTTDPVGMQTHETTVSSRGGSTRNLFGDSSSSAREDHDTLADVSALRDKAIYISAGNGYLTDEDRAAYGEGNNQYMAAGVILEQGSHYCTQKMVRALERENASNLKYNIQDHGAHHWSNFSPNLEAGWEHIKPSLM